MKSQFIGKDSDPGKDGRQKEKRVTEDEMVRHHRSLNGHESEKTPGDSGGQGSLACCSPWGRRESDNSKDVLTVFSHSHSYVHGLWCDE